ncbi:MAG TPA: MFS transporter [Roseiflexaceae bacterium]|nr:MFS transporter [Roseiflexaceae bacterium]
MTPSPNPAAEESAGGGRADALGALRLPNFRWLLSGTTLSNGAQWIQQVTLSWLVYDLTASGALLGTLSLVRAVATLGLAPVAGVAIDRLPRRTLMFAANTWLFAISLALGLALLAGHAALWPLFVFTFLGGVAQAVDLPLRQTVVFVLVPRPLAPAAVALVQTGWAVMRSLGPALGGFLILWFGPAGNFLIQAGAYALITLTIAQIRFPAEQAAPARGAALQNLGESLRFVATEPATRAFLLMSLVLPLFIIPIFAALPPIYAKDVFKGGPQVLGALLSAVGVGGIAGGLVTAALGRFEHRGVLQLAALLLLSLALIGFALSAALWLALVLLALAGFFEMVFLTTNQTLLQLAIPDALRGRVTSLASLSAGLAPLGSFLAGVGADFLGPQAITLLLSGTAAAIAVAVFWASPTIRGYRLSRALK